MRRSSLTALCNAYNIPLSSSSTFFTSSSLTTTFRRGTRKNIADAHGDREREDRRGQRQRGGGVAAEISAELRDQRADTLLQKTHRARGGAGGLGAHADGAGRRIVHHEGVGDHHDHLGAEQPRRRLVDPGDAPDQIEQAPPNCSASPNQISFSSEWRGAKRTQNTLPIR